MDHIDDWRLTISYWPRAIEAGVRPQAVIGFSLDDSPAMYSPHELDFTYPPTREDLLTVVARTPWMSGWRETLLPVIDANHWPMISPGYKGATVDLRDCTGRVVGRIEVWRKGRYENRRYHVPFFGTYPGSDIDRLLTRRVREKARREQAREHVVAHRYAIMERIAHVEDPSPTRLLDEVERVLTEGGFIKVKRAAAAA
jgi:hypothetical protein